MTEAGTLHDAFIDELRDSYDGEKQLTKALAEAREGRHLAGIARSVRGPPQRDARTD